MATAPTRPALRYHGGKWRLAPWILAHLPPHRVYVEPYAGAASVLLRKPRSYCEVLNDLNEEIVNVFRVLRHPQQAAKLERLLRLTPHAVAEFRRCYAGRPSSCVERARQTLIRSHMGWSAEGVAGDRHTGFRSGAFRRGTTPATDWARFPDQIARFTARLHGVTLECRPALELIAKFDDASTLFYVDPPYPHEARQPGGRYSYEMSNTDHIALAEALHQCCGMVALSGYRCPSNDALYQGWQCCETDTRADAARPRREALWLNAAASAACSQLTLPWTGNRVPE